MQYCLIYLLPLNFIIDQMQLKKHDPNVLNKQSKWVKCVVANRISIAFVALKACKQTLRWV